MTSIHPPPPATPPSEEPPRPDRRTAWLSWSTALLLTLGALFGTVTTVVVGLPGLIDAIRPTAQPAQLTITSPDDRLVPANGVVVRGTSTGLRPTDVLWVVTTEIGDTAYHPQNRPCQVAPTPNGEWICPETFIGGPQDQDRGFFLIVYRVDGQAVDAFLEYDRTKPPNEFPGMRQLPRGAEELGRIEVVRR